MCGVSGSISPKMAFKLYQNNLDRGFYSSGLMTVGCWGEHYVEINKILGKWVTPLSQESAKWVTPLEHILYHSRGPTVETNKFNPDNNHPFLYKDWVVAHNGIISNFEELGKKYFPDEDFTGKTDSCIIPRILSIKASITEALSELKGTFAVWIYNKSNHHLYIARSACTLFVDMSTGDFSSTHFDNSTSLEEDTLFLINGNNVIKQEKFKTNSPYFIF